MIGMKDVYYNSDDTDESDDSDSEDDKFQIKKKKVKALKVRLCHTGRPYALRKCT